MEEVCRKDPVARWSASQRSNARRWVADGASSKRERAGHHKYANGECFLVGRVIGSEEVRRRSSGRHVSCREVVPLVHLQCPRPKLLRSFIATNLAPLSRRLPPRACAGSAS